MASCQSQAPANDAPSKDNGASFRSESKAAWVHYLGELLLLNRVSRQSQLRGGRSAQPDSCGVAEKLGLSLALLDSLRGGISHAAAA